ncbi:dockerin type I domain-containing protein [uncultured Desulfosarcina sp.]|uniref:dockerin type I domain-containing protein n=1 Tax=uncultured Desulfosarcina sp. TaxID=218289 RepID=UPI003749427B
MKKRFIIGKGRLLLVLLAAILLAALPSASVSANDFDGYDNYASPTDQHYVVMPEITNGWFDAFDCFPDNSNGDTIGIYQTAGRMLVANDTYIYLQKNYGSGAGSGTWQPGDAHGVAGDNLPGGHANWIIVAEVTPGVGSGDYASMDPSFIHISPDGTKVALGMGWGQPLLVFPISMLDPDNPPLLNSGTGGNTAASGVTLFPWGSSPTDGVQYYEAEWVPDPEESIATLADDTLDPAAATNNTHLAINTDRGWSSSSQSGDGSQVEVLDTTSSSNRPVIIISEIGYSPDYSASADLTVDNYGNLITGQGYDYNNPTPGPNSETGQIKIFAADDWMDAYNGDPANPDPIAYDNTTNIIADNVLSAAALGVDKDNNLHVGGGDVVSGTVGETGFAAVIHADALLDALDDAGPVDESNQYMYKELQPDPNGDDSATFAVYNPWAEGIVLLWNPRQYSGSSYGPYDGWYVDVQPIATTYYNGTQPDTDGDGIPDGSDNAYLTANADQADSDGDGWADAVSGQQEAWAADIDESGSVNLLDYLSLKSAFGSSEGDASWNSDADIDESGSVNLLDYLIQKNHFGESTSPGPYY